MCLIKKETNQADNKIVERLSAPLSAVFKYMSNPVKPKLAVKRLWHAFPTVSPVTELGAYISMKHYSY